MKTDSYAVEKNIHFPTDINLSWDSIRKVFDTLDKLEKETGSLKGWRKKKVWRSKAKSQNRKVSNIHLKKGANYKERLKESAEELLSTYREVIGKVELTVVCNADKSSQKEEMLILQLLHYTNYLKKFTDQLERRLLKEEKIPHAEKIFSIFEPETEWLQKGKQNNKVELGHNLLVTTDQYNLIVDYSIMQKERDASQPLLLGSRIQKQYNIGYRYKSISFDRGFYSKLSKEGLEKIFDQVIMPKKGRRTEIEKEQESSKDYKKLLNRHSAIESNINELEQNGVDRVPDKGMKSFKRYVGLGVLSYNIKRLGKIIISQDQLNKQSYNKAS